MVIIINTIGISKGNINKKIEAKAVKKNVLVDYKFTKTSCGSTDIIIKSGRAINVTIYKKKKKIKTFKNVKKKKYNVKSYSSSNKYTIKVKVLRDDAEYLEIIKKHEAGEKINFDDYKVKVSCEVKPHQDIKKKTSTGVWIPYPRSAQYSNSKMVVRKTYISKEDIDMAEKVLSDESIVGAMDDANELTDDLLQIAIGAEFSKELSYVVGAILLGIKECNGGIKMSYVKSALKSIKKTAEYDKEKKCYKKGVVITEFFVKNAITGGYSPNYNIEPWTSSSIKGEKGYNGYWE